MNRWLYAGVELCKLLWITAQNIIIFIVLISDAGATDTFAELFAIVVF